MEGFNNSHNWSFGCLMYSSAIAYVAITLVTLTAQTLFACQQGHKHCGQQHRTGQTEMVNTYAAPKPSMPITASFFFKGSCTLRTIGTGRNKIAQSATTSVKSNERNMGTVSTHEFP